MSLADVWPLAVTSTAPARAKTMRAPPAPPLAVFPAVVALAAAIAAGQRKDEQLVALALATLTAASGASLLSHRRRSALGLFLLAASQVAIPLLGLRPSLYLLAGVALYVLYARWLEARTPFCIVVAGAALGCAVLAGWQTSATALRPAPFLVAVVIFLWMPGHLWSRSIAVETDHRVSSPASLAAVAGVEQTGVAVFASTIGLVVASIVLATQLGWPYAAVAVPAGACFLGATLPLRHRVDTDKAARAHRCSGAYLVALLAGLALSAI